MLPPSGLTDVAPSLAAAPVTPRWWERAACAAVGAAFELAVAAMLLTRWRVPVALGLAAVWTIGLIPAVGWPYWTTNVVLGSALALLWARASRSGRRSMGAGDRR